MKTKLFCLTLLAILLSFSKGYSQDDRWIYITETDEIIFYYDSYSVKHNTFYSVIIYEKWDYKISKYVDYGINAGKYIDYEIFKIEYDCKNYMSFTHIITYYYTDGSSSIVRHSIPIGSDIIPDTIGEAILLAVCR